MTENETSSTGRTTPGLPSARRSGEQAAREFGRRLRATLGQLDWSASKLGQRAGIDPSTVDKCIAGQTQPAYATVCKIVSSITRENPGLGAELVRELVQLCAPDAAGNLDYTGDGHVGHDDLLTCLAEMDNVQSELLLLGVESVANDRLIDDAEKLEIVAVLGRLRNHMVRCEWIVFELNDQYGRRRHGGNGEWGASASRRQPE